MIESILRLIRRDEDEDEDVLSPVRNISADIENEKIARDKLEESLHRAQEVREVWMAREIRIAREHSR